MSAPHSKSFSSTLPKPTTLRRAAWVLHRIGNCYKVNVWSPQGGFCPEMLCSNLLPRTRTQETASVHGKSWLDVNTCCLKLIRAEMWTRTGRCVYKEQEGYPARQASELGTLPCRKEPFYSQAAPLVSDSFNFKHGYSLSRNRLSGARLPRPHGTCFTWESWAGTRKSNRRHPFASTFFPFESDLFLSHPRTVEIHWK